MVPKRHSTFDFRLWHPEQANLFKVLRLTCLLVELARLAELRSLSSASSVFRRLEGVDVDGGCGSLSMVSGSCL